jgi:hypothetical protein
MLLSHILFKFLSIQTVGNDAVVGGEIKVYGNLPQLPLPKRCDASGLGTVATGGDWSFALFYLYRVLGSLNVLDFRKPNYETLTQNWSNLPAHLTLPQLSNVLYNYRRSIPIILFWDLKKKHNSISPTKSYILDSELNYVLKTKQQDNLSINFFHTNFLNTGFFLKMSLLSQDIFKATLTNNLVFSKQQRWLSRNNILSDKIILKTNN